MINASAYEYAIYEGVCFETTSRLIHQAQVDFADDKAEDLNKVRSNLSARWTLIYQFSDIVVFLSLSIFPLFLDVNFENTVLGLTFLGVITSALGCTFDPLGSTGAVMTGSEVYQSLLSVPQQFAQDARATLIAPFVFGFGITTAMFAYYVNGTITAKDSDDGFLYIGMLEAFSYLVAAVSAFPYAYVCNHYRGGSHIIMQFGSFSYMLSGVLVLVLSARLLGRWYNILLIRFLYGLGRGVFEGACRAVYAELFQGDSLSTAFSAQTLLAGFSGGVCFFAYDHLTKTPIGLITVLNGVLALWSYALLTRQEDIHEPIRWRNLKLCPWLYYRRKDAAGDDSPRDSVQREQLYGDKITSPLLNIQGEIED
ncbi:unnamed protein product [Sphagnum jensenii]|uniref:Uncharacterized protein n=1 Tax=Sphagnum jensenii TaxID=128206 RepID=A0ABP0VCT2_9BRYO